MADIFLSYSRADRPKAQIVAKSLEDEGFTVWWDKILKAGQTYDEVTEGMLRDAQVVVVLWSTTSVKSKWVRAEATLGQRTSTIIPAMIEDCERPIMFELTQSADLIGWDGDRSNKRWKEFTADIRTALEKAVPVEAPVPAPGSNDTMEHTFWTSIKDSDDPADFQAYLKRYPEGHFADLAKNRMSNGKPAASTPTKTPSPPSTTPVQPAASAQPKAEKKEKKKGGGLPIMALLALAILGGGGYFAWPYISADVNKTINEGTASVTGPQKFSDCDDCPRMVTIPEGEFLMGSPASEPGRTGNEGPMHNVKLTSYALSETEVTYDQWNACVTDGGCDGFVPPDYGFERGGLPVLGVSARDAREYIRWLSNKSGREYRLPSEGEWEYAARAGTTTPFWWGEEFDPEKAPLEAPVVAESLPRNPMGLRGVHGNAREWVRDCYINNYNNATGTNAPQLGGACTHFVLRGGAWIREPQDHRSANRARSRPDTRDRAFSFRVATSELPEE